MTHGYSRGQWTQIQSRWRKAGAPEVFKGDRCIACGKRFTHTHCPHSWEDNHSLIKILQKELDD